LLRSYTTGFAAGEQACLELKASYGWDALVHQIAGNGQRPPDADDLITVLTGDRDQRFDTGLLGQLYYCLQHRQIFDQARAFPTAMSAAA
jgi:hypothetical protein